MTQAKQNKERRRKGDMYSDTPKAAYPQSTAHQPSSAPSPRCWNQLRVRCRVPGAWTGC
jgi:hypothetical protein